MQDKRHIVKHAKFNELLTLWFETGGQADILPIANKQFPSRLWIEIDYRSHRLTIKPKAKVVEMMRRVGSIDQLFMEELKMKEHFHDLLCHGHIKTWHNASLNFRCVMEGSFLKATCHEVELYLPPELHQRLHDPAVTLSAHEELLKKLLG